MKKKIKIIDQIVEKHPAWGVKKGWSKYVGGMADTGEWFFRKMLDVPTNELQVFLDDINKKENAPPTPLTDQEIKDQSIIHQLPNHGFITEHERKNLISFYKEQDEKILYGK